MPNKAGGGRGLWAGEQIPAIIPVISEAIAQAKIKTGEIEAIAVTQGPGLIGSLLIGVETAKALAMAWKKPLIAVNHMVAHVFANWIGEKTPEFPAVALIVSGGHTDLMYLESLTRWLWVGGTRDDAAGEAFDRAARAMGFPYPGGPMVARAAGQSSEELPTEMKLPRPMIHEANLEMSFSGLKTALADVLIKKTMKAVEQYQPKSVLLAGGVAANVTLREGLAGAVKESSKEFFCPDLKYCTDNAAMIAACALLLPNYVDPLKLRPDPGLGIR